MRGQSGGKLKKINEKSVISFKPIIATFSLIATTINCHNKSYNFLFFLKILKAWILLQTYNRNFKTTIIGVKTVVIGL